MEADGPSDGSIRILIVDDDRDTADSLALLLGLWGHATAVAYSAEAALEAAPGFRPHLVLIDLGMHVMDGAQLARALRLLPETGRAWLIAVTGHTDAAVRARAGEAGIDLCLTKPVNPVALQILADALRPKGDGVGFGGRRFLVDRRRPGG
jgi:CheY-like chemotaxis protein